MVETYPNGAWVEDDINNWYIVETGPDGVTVVVRKSRSHMTTHVIGLPLNWVKP